MSGRIRRELTWFLFSGLAAVGTDAGIYFLLREKAYDHNLSKALSFISGSFVAYFLNKFITFKQSALSSKEPLRFMILYLLSFVANTGVHAWIYSTVDWPEPALKIFAFLAATATSTIMNYFGMKFWVFKKI